MFIDLKDLTEEQIELVTEELERRGFEHNVDFAALYGRAWKLVGVRLFAKLPEQLDVAVETLEDAASLIAQLAASLAAGKEGPRAPA